MRIKWHSQEMFKMSTDIFDRKKNIVSCCSLISLGCFCQATTSYVFSHVNESVKWSLILHTDHSALNSSLIVIKNVHLVLGVDCEPRDSFKLRRCGKWPSGFPQYALPWFRRLRILSTQGTVLRIVKLQPGTQRLSQISGPRRRGVLARLSEQTLKKKRCRFTGYMRIPTLPYFLHVGWTWTGIFNLTHRPASDGPCVLTFPNSLGRLFNLMPFMQKLNPVTNSNEITMVLPSEEVEYVVRHFVLALGKEWDSKDFCQIADVVGSFKFAVFLALVENSYSKSIEVSGLIEATQEVFEICVEDVLKKVRC